MLEKLRSVLLLLAPFIVKYGSEYLQKRRSRPKAVSGARLPWNLTVILMDGSDLRDHAEIPVKEAVAFIEARTRFDFSVRYVQTDVAHEYSPYQSDGRTKYVMLGGNVPQSFVDTLPVSTSYLFLYKLGEKEALQAGSAMAIEYGVNVGGKLRPYATVPTDQWWYKNEPQGGFDNWSAQIVTHEIINTIQAKVEAPPFSCGKLDGTAGEVPNVYEAQRLEKLTDRCYELLGTNED